jgi:acyl-CoA thioester hydrolase
MVDGGHDLVVAEAKASFRGFASFDEEIDIGLSINRLGETSMTTDVTIRREDALLVEGHIVHVWVDAETHQKVAIPDHARDKLAQFS